MKRRGLGRGLDALLPSTSASEEEFRSVPVGELTPNPKQPRSQVALEGLEGLAASIASQGVLEPIVVREEAGKLQIIAGERRWRAARMAGLEKVPVVVREATDDEVRLLALAENVQREDLNPVEEALAFRGLAEEGRTHEEIAAEMGKSRAAVTNALRLLDLTPQVRRQVENGELHAAAARALLPLAPARQRELAEDIIRGGLSVREVERRVEKLRDPQAAGGRKRTPRLDPNTRAAQEQMQAAAGLPVQIRRRGKGGSVRIQFFSENDLQRLFELMTGSRGANDPT